MDAQNCPIFFSFFPPKIQKQRYLWEIAQIANVSNYNGIDIYRKIGKVQKSGCVMKYTINKHTQLPLKSLKLLLLQWVLDP